MVELIASVYRDHCVKIEVVLAFGFGFNCLTPINLTDSCWFNDEIVSLEFNSIND